MLAAALACACGAQTGPEGGMAGGSQAPEASAVTDTAALPGPGSQTRITLNGTGADVAGTGAGVSGDRVVITQAGEYLITGSFRGQIYVEAGKKDEVVLRLSGAEITNSDDAAIHIENAGMTCIRTDAGTENLLQSGAAPAEGVLSATPDEEASGGALYAKDDLTLAGEGSLRVLGYLNNGIQTSNDLVITGGNIAVEAVNNGVKGKDSVTVTGGTLDIQAGNDGIKSDDDTGEGYGTVTVTGGDITIQAAGDGIQAETTLEITGGAFAITTGGGSQKAVTEKTGGWGMGPGRFGMGVNENWDMEDEGGGSAKGLKSGVSTTISGGTVTADCLDDAIHSNGDITITGGTFTLASGDDGVHADNALIIRDGRLTITGSYEGLEANLITIDGGELDVTARDDGINAYGGQNRMGGGRGGFGGGKTTDTMPELTINGGTITVNADGDGLDSNGHLTINGGFTIVNGPTNSGNGALDIGTENGGRATVTGGTVLALGAGGMDETFDGSSTQCSLRQRFPTAFSAGEEIVITDADGKELIRHTAVKSGSSVVFTSPQLTQGGAYTVRAGSQTESVTLDSVSTSAGAGGGFGGFGGQRPDRGDRGGPGGFDGRQPPERGAPAAPPYTAP